VTDDLHVYIICSGSSILQLPLTCHPFSVVKILVDISFCYQFMSGQSSQSVLIYFCIEFTWVVLFLVIFIWIIVVHCHTCQRWLDMKGRFSWHIRQKLFVPSCWLAACLLQRW